MKLHRFYQKENIEIGISLEITDDKKLHQWLSVFRFSSGDKIVLFNGNGNEYEVEFVELHKKKAVLNILSEKKSYVPKENGKELHLYVAAIKKDLFEFVVEKCIELGVSSITPIVTERTQNKNLNMERLEKVAIEASEQSGRGDVPNINKAVSLEKALESVKGSTIYVADIQTSSGSQSTAIPAALFIGPEGGWGEKDYELFKKYSVNYISLGETTLRAETAAIVGSFMFIR